jgi:hypothetical protein
MKLREIIQQAIEMQGIATIKGAAKKAGVSTECMRMVLSVHTTHIPKDNTLIKMSKNLGLDPQMVILAAHRGILSEIDDDSFLAPIAGGYEKKRVWPLSQEQCHYLEKILLSTEIQLIRKYRQVATEGQVQIKGYVDFMFTSHRSKPPSGQD